MAGDRIQATLQLRREVAEAGETLGSDHGNNACIQKHSLCDWGSTKVLGLKGGPLLPPHPYPGGGGFFSYREGEDGV